MPATVSSARRPVSRPGFTLIELLVVVGIIVVLISILLPVIGAVRRKAAETVTTAELGRIAAGIQAYYNDFRSYPGPVPEADIVSGSNASFPGITSTENLSLGLLGGAVNSAGTIGYDKTLVLQGPRNLGSSGKAYNAYVNVTPEELSPLDAGGNYIAFNTTGPAVDTVIPEFLDHINGGIIPTSTSAVVPNTQFITGPILYFRARVGQSGVVTTTQPSNTGVQQFRFADAAPYGFSDVSSTDFPLPNPNPPTAGQPTTPDNTTVYFSNPNIYLQPRSKDSFILISAGTDRKFGTKDDIIYAN